MPVLKSVRFGEITVAEEDGIDFPKGLVGFPDGKRYYLVQHKFPFFWLHSATDPEVAFAVVDSSYLVDVPVKIPKQDPTLALKPGDQLATLFVLTMTTDPASSTVNLKAPLVLNTRAQRGLQIVIEDDNFSVAEPLLKRRRLTKK